MRAVKRPGWAWRLFRETTDAHVLDNSSPAARSYPWSAPFCDAIALSRGELGPLTTDWVGGRLAVVAPGPGRGSIDYLVSLLLSESLFRMGLAYFKRYRMEIDLTGIDLSWATLPAGYQLVPWDVSLLDSHAAVKYHSFRDEIDANVFPCFTAEDGCQRLMRDIAKKEGFLPETTWLAAFQNPDESWGFCGTIQGLRSRPDLGAIQNVGIVPSHRGRGLGTCLLQQALAGFRQVGLNRVYLEVTADNRGAIRLYRRLGFVAVKTLFKEAKAPCA